MILTKNDRTRLQEIIHGELRKIEKHTPETGFLFVISTLISDFEEMEELLSNIYSIFASGEEIAEILNYLSDVLSPDLIEKLHFEGQSELIKNLTLLANSAQNLKYALAVLHDNKHTVAQ